MKVLIIFIFFPTLLFSQDKEYLNIKKYEELSINKIYDLNTDLLHKYEHNNGKYKILYSFATWCSPCVEFIPTIINLQKKLSNTNIYVYGIETKTKRQAVYLDFFKNKNYQLPVFNLESKESSRRFKKYDKFLVDILGTKFNPKYIGLSKIIILDENFKVLFESNYNMNNDDIRTKIEQIVK
ncbi:TlpA family protein disulfide reductase [Bizionia saleffrena]|uniref:TlpA family protein disulfide reductase n=1 Tax=Bizionia saleffrena TaxID=291189 RepID=A0A8H2LE48_9FLAO|nr:TlpA disulfide reductase family protein [Bizionia saleffrena]TYB73012.1 TlpA family protein disulfide reductase [Bizionia saleffrena]